MNDFLKTKAGLNYLQMKYPNSTVMDAVSEFNKRTQCPCSINNKYTNKQYEKFSKHSPAYWCI